MHPGHSHGTPSRHAPFAIGVLLNVAFVAAEVWYGLAANSLALLSDAGHNASDVLALLVAWAASWWSGLAPTKHRTYGLRRTSIFAAVLNAALLLLVIGAIVWEALGRLVEPPPVASNTMIAVAAIGVLVNGGTALLFMGGHRHDLNKRGAFLHMAADAGVSLGVVLAGIAIGITELSWLDPATSLAVCAVIVWSTWGLLRESVDLALDAVPKGIDPHAVEGYLRALPGVHEVHDLHIWAMSTTESALTAHLVMPQPPGDDRFLSGVCHELEHRFAIGHVTIQVEFGDGDAQCKQAGEHAL